MNHFAVTESVVFLCQSHYTSLFDVCVEEYLIKGLYIQYSASLHHTDIQFVQLAPCVSLP